MADAIARGISNFDESIEIKLFQVSSADQSDITTEVFRSKGVLFGSPTYNSSILKSIASLLFELRGMRLSTKRAAAFGSFGWATKNIETLFSLISKCGFEIKENWFISSN